MTDSRTSEDEDVSETQYFDSNIALLENANTFTTKPSFTIESSETLVSEVPSYIKEHEEAKEETWEPKAVKELMPEFLDKIKEFFLHSQIEDHKLAEFMFEILKLNTRNLHNEEVQMSPDVLDQIVDRIVANSEHFNVIIDKILGPHTTQTVNDKQYMKKVEVVIRKLFGDDKDDLDRKKLTNDNLDQLLEKLIAEKRNLNDNSLVMNQKFEDIIDKILGKENEEIIKEKLELYLNSRNATEDATNNDNE